MPQGTTGCRQGRQLPCQCQLPGSFLLKSTWALACQRRQQLIQLAHCLQGVHERRAMMIPLGLTGGPVSHG
jgi:hypothetical protein